MVGKSGVLIAGSLLLGCGRMGFGEGSDPATVDAAGGGGDGGGSDGGVDAAAVTTLFSAPQAVASLNSGSNDGSFRATADELGGWMWSNRSGNNELYEATRPDLASPWTLAQMPTVNTPSSELDPTTTPDGLILVFRSNRAGGSGGNDIYLATRPSVFTSFSAVTAIGTLNTASSEVQTFLRADGAELYFTSNRTGNYDIYRSTRIGTTFGAPVRVDELNTSSNDEDPVLSADGLTVYWRSDRPGGLGGGDIYSASRTTITETFGSASPVANVNTAFDDGASWASNDNLRLYVSSNRAGGNHIYVATRTP